MLDGNDTISGEVYGKITEDGIFGILHDNSQDIQGSFEGILGSGGGIQGKFIDSQQDSLEDYEDLIKNTIEFIQEEHVYGSISGFVDSSGTISGTIDSSSHNS